MKTNDLRKLIQSKLLTVCDDVYYCIAPSDKMYPHIVWDMSSVDLGDLSRDDVFLDIDIWDKGNSCERIEDLADSIDALLRSQNLPQDTILPTFYIVKRVNVEDTDKNIKHRVLTFSVQNYER